MKHPGDGHDKRKCQYHTEIGLAWVLHSASFILNNWVNIQLLQLLYFILYKSMIKSKSESIIKSSTQVRKGKACYRHIFYALWGGAAQAGNQQQAGNQPQAGGDLLSGLLGSLMGGQTGGPATGSQPQAGGGELSGLLGSLMGEGQTGGSGQASQPGPDWRR